MNKLIFIPKKKTITFLPKERQTAILTPKETPAHTMLKKPSVPYKKAPYTA